MKRLLPAVLCASFVLAGCASEGPGYRTVGEGGYGRGGGGDDAPRERGLPNLFISPAGKPYRAARGEPYPVNAWFAAADKNHDGKITLEEFRADAIAFFDELDANHDGVIDGFESQAYEQRIAPEILPRIEGLAAEEGMNLTLGRHTAGEPEIGASRGARGGRERAGDRKAQGAGLFGLLNEPEPVTAADTQFDSKITRQEFLSAADRRFEALDIGREGYLTLATLPKTPVQQAIEAAAKRANPPSNR